MRLRDFLTNRLGNIIPDHNLLPSGFHLVGHVVLLTLNSAIMEYSKLIGDAILEYDHRAKSVAVRTGPTTGINRSPSYKVVSGNCNTTTTHVENGIKFRLNPVRITFSGGNKRERVELPKRVRSGEKVVDMFSCVGQFALHIAKTIDTMIIAIEINPEAYRFLVENIEINGFEGRVIPLLGDCREVHPINYANRVVMGYLHDTLDYLPHALDTLITKGGDIHMHIALPRKDLEKTGEKIGRICKEKNFVPVIKIRKIKNYSPGIDHFVFDIRVVQYDDKT